MSDREMHLLEFLGIIQYGFYRTLGLVEIENNSCHSVDAVALILDVGDVFVNSVGKSLTRETDDLVGGIDQFTPLGEEHQECRPQKSFAWSQFDECNFRRM